ncbi:c-type cytochrome [Marichromatium bheemlicum]|uniref:C-type cytochrome n=1 Tax=Marichromatium bheemlicum TaxID=365339 RepID=A0ABX1I4I7_9GAMM|nr:c-type cytochrome [Marichromatium bheemlicum]NKN32473.1 c-type cytochrome [Marichromatium bheemlicum]
MDRLLLLIAAAIPSVLAQAQPMSLPHAPGIESPDYVWNAERATMLQALRDHADPERGAYAYLVCRRCHGHAGEGDTAGRYPRLAGQHATVLIKQLNDIRAGQRDNAQMYPAVSEHQVSARQLADIALHLERLDPPTSTPAPPHTTAPTLGARLYRRDCLHCHGEHAQGDANAFYPRLADQHPAYLLRQAQGIRDRVRRNADPEMVETIAHYSDPELEAVIAHIATLSARAGRRPR